MLKYRILTALVLIPLLILLVLKATPIVFCVVTGLIVLWGALEWSFFMGVTRFPHCLIYPSLMFFILLGALELPVISILYGTVIWWLIALLLVVSYPKTTKLWGKSIIVRGLIGIAVLIPCWLAMNFIRNADNGPYIMLFLFALIFGADTGAYFTGRKWGKHKLAPTVSPGKTWEGLIGALVTTSLIAMSALYFLNIPQTTWLPIMIVAMITVLFSVLGDLFESMLKRNAGLKDSGHLLPGHGGILDRIDSLTAAAPIFAVGEIFLGKFFQ